MALKLSLVVEAATQAAQRSLQDLAKAEREIGAAAQAGNGAATESIQRLNNSVSTAVQAQRNLRQALDASMASAENQNKVVDQSVSIFGKLAAATIAYKAIGFGQQIVDTVIQFDNLDQKLQAVFGSTQASNQEFQFSRNTATRLGLDIQAVAGSYASLAAASKGTTLEGQKTRDVFSAVAEASGRLHLSTDQTSGALLAVSQIISKGTVQAEELRGQLGERIPGAFQIAARAIGVTTTELGNLLEQGSLTADEFLPKFAAELRRTFGTDSNTSVASTQSNFARLRNEIALLASDLGGPLVRALSSAGGAAASALEKSRQARELGGRETFNDGSSAVLFRGIAIETQAAQADLSKAVPFRNLGQAFRPAALIGQDFGPQASGTPNLFPITQETKRTAELREQLALAKARTEEEKALYQVTTGSLKNASNLEKNLILERARALDGRKNETKSLRGAITPPDTAQSTDRILRANLDASVAQLNAAVSARTTTEAQALDQTRQLWASYYQGVVGSLQQALASTAITPDQRQKLTADLAAARAEAVAKDADLQAKQTELLRRGEQDRARLVADTAKSLGDTRTAALAQLDRDYSEQLAKLTNEGVADAQAVADAWREAQQQAIDVQSIADQVNTAQNRFKDQQLVAGARVDAGDTTPSQARTDIADAAKEEIATLTESRRQILDLLNSYPDNPRLVQILATIDGELKKTGDIGNEVFRQIGQGLQGDIQSFFQNITSGSESSGGAFKKLGLSIISTIQKVAAEAAAKQFLQLLGFGGGGAGGGNLGGVFQTIGLALGFAEGGAVRGPGGPTSDQIPAMLSNGEYVLRAAAVQRLGVGFLDAVNGGSTRRVAAFAAGGLVGSVPAGAGAGGFGGPSISVTNNYDFRGAGPDQVQQLLQYGEKIKNDTKREIFDAIKRRTAPTK